MSTDQPDITFIALLPAAGIGTRMASEIPKQYLHCHSEPLMCHSLALFQKQDWLAEIMVAISPEDEYWDEYCAGRFSKCQTTQGGASRAESVRNGLKAIKERFPGDNVWVLVHDAARPCLTESDLNSLRDAVLAHNGNKDYGVILADKVHDTVKKVDSEGKIISTEDRAFLWRAQTPQLFELSALLDALNTTDLETITDEASAMEQAGFSPEVLQGASTNIKVTTATDLALAELFLSQMEDT